MKSKNTAFTICAKNYLAQALTLRESVLKHNDIDFFIFLADDTEGLTDENVVALDKQWISHWVSMAFKYDVIEFNTSIKPFCINKLFNDGYEKVIYLDPDIYVTAPLDYIYEDLDSSSIVLTPHYSDIVEHFEGGVSEYTFMSVGVFNLGFCALKNDNDGKEIVTWWMNRLESDCYSERSLGLFVDQKWMDFIPAFFPNSCKVSHHFGLNVAVWNLHERTLFIKDDKYIIHRIKTGEDYPLIFFHFSGFDPFNTEVINRRHPQFNIHKNPSFKPIIEEYRKAIYANGYDTYNVMTYAFNFFKDGKEVHPLHRRMFKAYLEKYQTYDENPFESSSPFYQKLVHKGLMLPYFSKGAKSSKITSADKKQAKKLETKIIQPLMRLFLKLTGLKRYAMLVRYAQIVGEKNYHSFLIDE